MKRAITVLTIALGLSAFAIAAKNDVTPSMIRTMVDYKLIEDKISKGDSVKVQVGDGGVVTLEGEVESVSQKRRAEKIAYGVTGVTRVENRLTVSMRGDMPDKTIGQKVASEIRSSVWFDIFDWVEGTVENGKVVLKGYVREPWRRAEYGKLAEGVRGVADVDNQIKALPLSTFDDQLRIQLASAIYGNPNFVRYANRSLPPIHIVVDNGKVFLKGAVNNQLEKQLAGQLANQSQAFEVVNDLQVDSEAKK